MTSKILNDLIHDVNHNTIVRFFQERTSLFQRKQEQLTDYDRAQFTQGIKLGEIPLGLIDHIIVCAFNVTHALSERSGKKAQYDLAKKIIQDMGVDAGIFVFIGENGNFRFSLVYQTYLGTKAKSSDFRRFTYFVSPELTNKTFIQRIGEGDFSSLESIKEAFSVEKVTKEFYQKISYWYFWACQQCQFPKDAESEENGRQVAVIRLITRMIFIWFMREMKLVPNHLFEEDFFKKALKEVDLGNSTYYLAVLQNLFFATLNTKPEERTFRSQVRGPKGYNPDFGNQYKYRYQDLFHEPEQLKEYFGEIPFLNGGLFECLDDKENLRYVDGFTETKKHQPLVPNAIFFSSERNVDINAELGTTNRTYRVEGLIDILSTYNFTIDENTLYDQDVALDPELLGKVFENLLASFNPETSSTARKATGSYYTPREIVDYMVEEALKGYFQTHLEDVEDLEDKLNDLFAQNTEDHRFTDEEARRMVAMVENVRIVDPAVGSGAFPMGALNKLVFILSKLDKDNVLWKQTQVEAADAISDPAVRAKVKESIQTYFREKDANYGRKLYLIQKCIYGVDIQQIAVEIAKLRFFISLLVDEKVDNNKDNWGIEPLPNLDFKIMQGNSLISEYLGINFSIGGDAPQANGTLPLFEDENKRLIEQFDQMKTAYQIAFDPQHKKALEKEIEDLLITIFEDLVRKQEAKNNQRLGAIDRKYANIPDKEARAKAIASEKGQLVRGNDFDLHQAKNDLRKFTSRQRIKPFFPWELYFSEVFLEKGGFDIVIANPPYIRQEEITDKESLEKRFTIFNSVSDLYTYFYELGFDLLKDKGVCVYITSSKFTRARYGSKLRAYIKNNTKIKKIVNFGDHHVFNAITNTLVFVSEKGIKAENEFMFADDIDEDQKFFFPQAKLHDREWTIERPEIINLKEKIEIHGKVLKKWNVRINYGIKTGYNEAFIVDELMKGKFIEKNPKSADILKPIIRGRDIDRFNIKSSNLWLITTFPALNLDINQYPIIKNYLSDFGKKLHQIGETYIDEHGRKQNTRKKTGNKWYETQDQIAYYPEFEKEKIIWLELTNKNKFAYSNQEDYILAGAFLLVGEHLKYLLSFLNSNLCYFYFSLICNSSGMATNQWKKFAVEKIPVKQISTEEEKPFIEIVDEILSITDQKGFSKKDELIKQKLKLEKQIDFLFYKLYMLSDEEIKLVENYP